jgi:hypothetical protein
MGRYGTRFRRTSLLGNRNTCHKRVSVSAPEWRQQPHILPLNPFQLVSISFVKTMIIGMGARKDETGMDERMVSCGSHAIALRCASAAKGFCGQLNSNYGAAMGAYAAK